MPDVGPARAPVTVNGLGLFAATDGTDGLALWVTDGPVDGTHALVASDSDRHFRFYTITNFAGAVYFLGARDIGDATLPEAEKGLWRTDGTPDGTALVAPLD